MKKDYITLTAPTRQESAFAEEYWTRTWEQHDLEKDIAARVEKSDEYAVLASYISRLPATARLLDGGCGLGHWTRYFSERGYEVCGLDISRKTIERLQKEFPGCRFSVGDIRKTEFGDEYFEAYFSLGTFEHFEIGLGPCFQEAHRILKPGGYLFVSVPE